MEKELRFKERISHLAAQFLSKESSRLSLITVTRAEISKDFKNSIIYITVLPESNEKEALEFVKRKRSDFRQYVKANSRLFRIPFFDFEIDVGEKVRQKIDLISNEPSDKLSE
ncbi:MAG: ribosome-binding factor A [Candidatus Paceibacterota bacterium]